jgi:hypothetical protein
VSAPQLCLRRVARWVAGRMGGRQADVVIDTAGRSAFSVGLCYRITLQLLGYSALADRSRADVPDTV